MEKVLDKWTGKINEVTIGATPQQGGSREKSITIGGQTGMFYIKDEGITPNTPVVAMEVWDVDPGEVWPEVLRNQFGDVLSDPAQWAKKCVDDFGAELICLKLEGTHPDKANKSARDGAATVKAVLEAVKVPLIITGSGNAEKDNEIFVDVSEAAKGEKVLLGIAEPDNYKTLVASAASGGHSVIAESPIDINIAKQLNILICDMDFPQDKIVMHPATGALGYGLEYTYSIMERSRLAALSGDKMMSMPVINFVGQEVWKTKEAKTPDSENHGWGKVSERGPMWEISTAVTYLHAGSDILVLCHPRAVETVKWTIAKLMGK